MSPYRTRHIERLELLHSLFPKSLVFAELADAYRVAGDLDLALKTARAGLEQHPDYVEGFLVLARALVEGAKPRQAEAALRQVLDLEPTNVEAQEALATLKRVREATEESESDTSTGAPGGRGMELPHGWEARWSYGQAERAARQTEDAPPADASGAEAATAKPFGGAGGPVPEVSGRGEARAVIGDQLAELIGWEPTLASRRREPGPGEVGKRRETARGAPVDP
ncbi:MAG: tetratricopeptide repeat protein, partial [Longimicrobiales bacterium]